MNPQPNNHGSNALINAPKTIFLKTFFLKKKIMSAVLQKVLFKILRCALGVCFVSTCV